MSTSSSASRSEISAGSVRAWGLLRAAIPLAGLIAVFCIAFFGEQGLMENHDLRVELSALRGELDDLRTTNAELARQVEDLTNDPAAIERAIREEMFMVRKDHGEVIFDFRGADEGAEDGADPPPADGPADPDTSDGGRAPGRADTPPGPQAR